MPARERSLRILHILDHSIPLHSGYAFRTLAILREQRALGWQTFQLTTPKHVLQSSPVETVDGFEFYRTRRPSAIWSRMPFVREFAQMNATGSRLGEVIRQVQPDILHAHSPVLNAIPALRAGRRLGLPVVYEIRAFWEDAAVSHGTSRSNGVRYALSRAVESYAVRNVDAVTTICQGMRDDLIARGISPTKVSVIPNAVDPEEFDSHVAYDPRLASQLGIDGKLVLGFIGSFYGYEGLHLLLRAMPLLADSLPEACVLLVGGGPEEAALKALADRLNITDRVLFTGRVPHQAVQAYYGLTDILIYPRLSIRLTELVTPLKPLEAMAQGKIVVASDVGGHRELISDGVTGNLFAADNVEDLASTIVRVVANRSRWPEQIQRARLYVESERTWRKSVQRYREIYSGLIGRDVGCA